MAAAESFAQIHARLIARLYARVNDSASVYGGVPRELFISALERSAKHRFPTGASTQTIADYLESLHLEDLALACACSEGGEPAWRFFVEQYRPVLYAAARAICPRDEAAARDLADSLYAELFGVRGESSEHRSLFDYFHGRSKLSTWLRSVLAQRRIDQLRVSRRMESLDDEQANEDGRPAGPHSGHLDTTSGQDPDRGRYLALLQAALTAALAALPARDRLRLSLYYLQDLTLAQIGRITSEHEATVSRHLDRTRRDLRQQVENALRAEKRLSDAQIKLCYEYAMEEWPFDLSRALSSVKAED